MTRFAELGRNGVGEAVLCLRVSPRGCLAASAVSASRLPSAPLPESPVDGRDGAVRGQRGAAAGEETNGGAAVAAAAGGSSDEGRRPAGRREEAGGEEDAGRKKAGGEAAPEGGSVGLGDGLQSLGLHQLLSGGGSLCTLFFFILSRYSCWDTASTEARISSSSQSFSPKAEGDICWMRARHSRAG